MGSEGTRWLRGGLILLFASWMLGSPVYRQVFEGEAPFVREWRMYGTRAARVCQVYFEEERDGAWVRFSRWERMGYSLERFPGRSQRLLDSPEEAQRAGRVLCDRAPGPLRFRQRCGHVRDGWSPWAVVPVECGR